MKLLYVLPVAAALATVGCESKEHLSSNFGNSVNHNMSLHIVNPDPVYMAPEIPDLNGVRAAGAVERYETGTVIDPQQIDTSDVSN